MRRIWMAMAFVSLCGVAKAHDWYPMDCCHGQDCAEVEKVDASSIHGMVVTSRHGTAFVPATFPRRESRDHRMHVCMRLDATGTMKVICVFMPPAT